jgi:hypothetical protein
MLIIHTGNKERLSARLESHAGNLKSPAAAAAAAAADWTNIFLFLPISPSVSTDANFWSLAPCRRLLFKVVVCSFAAAVAVARHRVFCPWTIVKWCKFTATAQ